MRRYPQCCVIRKSLHNFVVLECRWQKCRRCSSVSNAENSTTRTCHSGHTWRRTKVCVLTVSCAHSSVSDELHKCDQCPRKYKSRGALRYHKRTAHTEAGHFECGECGKICPHNMALLNHKRVHSECSECPVCSKKMRPAGLSAHMKTHAGEELAVKTLIGSLILALRKFRTTVRMRRVRGDFSKPTGISCAQTVCALDG